MAMLSKLNATVASTVNVFRHQRMLATRLGVVTVKVKRMIVKQERRKGRNDGDVELTMSNE